MRLDVRCKIVDIWILGIGWLHLELWNANKTLTWVDFLDLVSDHFKLEWYHIITWHHGLGHRLETNTDRWSTHLAAWSQKLEKLCRLRQLNLAFYNVKPKECFFCPWLIGLIQDRIGMCKTQSQKLEYRRTGLGGYPEGWMFWLLITDLSLTITHTPWQWHQPHEPTD